MSSSGTKPLPCPDPERIWLEPCTMSDGWGTWCDRNAWRDPSGVEYVRADLYEQAQAELEEERLRSCRTCETAGAVVRRLKRQLAEAQQRAGLFEGLPEPDRVSTEWDVPEQRKATSTMVRKGLQIIESADRCSLVEWVYDDTEYRGPDYYPELMSGTLAECLTALRTELQENSDE